MRVTMYRIVTAKHYFEVVLQDVLAVRGCIVKSVNAMIAIAVEGQGVWTLDLRRNGTGRVHRGTVRNIDALIQVSARFFPTFANENYDARQALAAGEMII
ncbi:MAG: SCP2 sterol-binding domain-containing protein, partial [Myxococcota bacterium]